MKRCKECNVCYEDGVVSCIEQGHTVVFEREGTRLIQDRYLLEKWLGGGGMGAVYRALDTRIGRQVAIKLLRISTLLNRAQQAEPDRYDDPQELDKLRENYHERFRREAAAANTLSHCSNIVTVHDYGVLQDDEAFICMEMIDGQDLKAFLKAHTGPLNINEAI